MVARAQARGPYLFPGRAGIGRVTTRAMAIAMKQARTRAGVGKRVSPHALRHNYATQGEQVRAHSLRGDRLGCSSGRGSHPRVELFDVARDRA